ncbi:hypothetical protein K9M42_02765 [Patescibacteria group bacterium]|nr:hypothetical protein [Patescibacteria group bacterium]
MGCNFYIEKENNETIHIGKRSAAGHYCWDCNITLCKEGEQGIHSSDSKWHERCPFCNKLPKNETIENSAAGLELGFNSDFIEPLIPKGMRFLRITN